MVGAMFVIGKTARRLVIVVALAHAVTSCADIQAIQQSCRGTLGVSQAAYDECIKEQLFDNDLAFWLVVLMIIGATYFISQSGSGGGGGSGAPAGGGGGGGYGGGGGGGS